MDPHAPNATIVARRDLNSRVAILHVRPDAGPVAEFVPGQFVQLGLPADEQPVGDPGEPTRRTRLVKRSYSIASAPHEKDAFELCVAFVDGGHLTPKLRPLAVGARLWLDATPKGFFTLERVPRHVDLLLVATGTGIAPFVSMLRHERATRRLERRFVFVHGARERSDLAYGDELGVLARADSCVRHVPVLSRGDAQWSGLRGRVQVAIDPARFADVAGFALEPAMVHVLLCGNPQMIQDVRESLAPRGFVADTVKVPGNLHFERYW